MGNIFNYDNKFFRALSKVVDCVILSALWVIFCIPIFTIGASTTALYYTSHKTMIRGKGYVLSTFWSSFKSNFKKSTGIWLIQLVITIILLFDMWLSYNMALSGQKLGMLYYAFLIMLIYIVVWTIYTYSYAARFENTWKNIMKNAAIFSVAHLPWSIVLLVLMAAVLFMIAVMPPFIFLLPAALTTSYDMILDKRVYRKYMSEEDLQKELEDDMYNED